VELALQVVGSYDEVLRAARFAEERRLAAISLPDHYLLGRSTDDLSKPAADALTQLAGLARDTDRIALGVLVSPITFRHPAVLVKIAVTIDRMSGGRFSLGIGTGWLDEEHTIFGIPYPPLRERFELLEEALGYLRAALAPEPTAFEGSHFRLEAFDIQPRPVGPLPLIVGGTGREKTPRLAGRYADEYNVYAQPADDIRRRIETARQAAEAAGRDPEALVITTACAPIVGTDEASLRQRLGEMASRFDREPAELEQRWRESGYPIGGPDQAREILAAWEDLGIQRFYVQTFASNHPDDIAETLDVLGG
jgi:alkanesulfonate monooxygenase SsuD/methylene tetrahydromethanopterin reductase-like flavin-dependent oxidoreductase (luciferase family)